MSTRTGTQLIGRAPAMDRLREMILRVVAQPGTGAHLR